MDEALKLAEIKGYLTAMVDKYARTRKYNPRAMVANENVVEDFSSLLDMVIDMADQSKGSEVYALIQRVKELEESCEDMCAIERNLHKKIADLQGVVDHYRNKIKSMQGCKPIEYEVMEVQK